MASNRDSVPPSSFPLSNMDISSSSSSSRFYAGSAVADDSVESLHDESPQRAESSTSLNSPVITNPFASGVGPRRYSGASEALLNKYAAPTSGLSQRGSFMESVGRSSTLNFPYNNSETSLVIPAPPFARSAGNKSSSSSTSSRPLSVNYLPTKFSEPHRQGERNLIKKGERYVSVDPDPDSVNTLGNGPDDNGKGKKRKLHWNRFKVILFCFNTALMGWSLAGLILLLLVFFNIWEHSVVVLVGLRTPLILSTACASLGLFTSILGFSGILLNNRSFLAIYTLLLWAVFALLVTPGYVSYKQAAFNLEGKINKSWSRDLGLEGRLRIQDALNCCGYYSPYVEASLSASCYARSTLPGCKGHYLRLSRSIYRMWYTVSFSLVPLQLGIMVAALLCSNHVTYRFGKGLTPEAYRLDLKAVGEWMDTFAGEIASAYGEGVAHDAINRSSSNLDAIYLASQNNLPGSRQSSFSLLGMGGSGRHQSVPFEMQDAANQRDDNSNSPNSMMEESSQEGRKSGGWMRRKL